MLDEELPEIPDFPASCWTCSGTVSALLFGVQLLDAVDASALVVKKYARLRL
jgi:hypothetical protein